MIGKEVAQISLMFGTDDLDGTIADTQDLLNGSAGEKNPEMTTDEICKLIRMPDLSRWNGIRFIIYPYICVIT